MNDQQWARHHLPSSLREALREFDRGAELQDGGRGGIYVSLSALVQFAVAHLPHSDLGLLRPITCLMDALEDLDNGNVHPALARRVVPNRLIDRALVRQVKATCLVAADVIHKHGLSDGRRLIRKEADRAVFDYLRPVVERLGIRGTRNCPATAESIGTWRKSLRKARLRKASDWLASQVDELAQLAEYLIKRGCVTEAVAGQLLACVSPNNLLHLPPRSEGE